MMRTWFHSTRMIYNRCVEHANATGETTLSALRAASGISDSPWKADFPDDHTPYEVRDSPVRDLCKAAAAIRAKAKKPPVYKYRTRKDLSESITLRSRQLNCKRKDCASTGPWPLLFGTVDDRSAMATERGKTLPSVFAHDVRLTYERKLNRYCLCIPEEVVFPSKNRPCDRDAENIRLQQQKTLADAPESQGRPARVCSVDPGVRVFATTYSPSGAITEWGGDGLADKLRGLRERADLLDKKAREQKRGRARRRTEAAAARLRDRGRNLADELHRKLSLFLFGQHEVVFLPKFDVQNMIAKRKKDPQTGEKKEKKRAFGSKTAGGMCCLSHYRFRQFAAHKARELGSTLVICDEAYTSKTCGSCGRLNPGLSGSKDFVCPACGYAADRDHNAARNILIRAALCP